MYACASGAMDINTFRQKVKKNSLPDVSNITYEGLFNEYYFDTLTNIKGDDEKSYTKEEQLLIPTYCFAKTSKPKPLQMAEALNINKDKSNSNNTLQTNDVDNNDKDVFEYYMNVGLNENFDVNTMQRKNLNLVIVLDNSGSMEATFDDNSDGQTKRELPPQCPICCKFVKRSNSYISWDNIMNEHIESMCSKAIVDDEEQLKLDEIIKNEQKSKMDIANQSVITLLSQLNDEDRFALIVFNDKSTMYQKLTFIKDIKMDELHKKIMNITPGGGTDMEVAYKDATSMYHDVFESIKQSQKDIKSNADNANIVDTKDNDDGDEEGTNDLNEGGKKEEMKEEYANRIIFITDAIPNAENNKDALLQMVQNNASTEQYKGLQIHTSFIGVGIDFNTELVEKIIKVEGGNYYSVHSNDEFLKTMNDEFKFMVTPLVFNFILTLMAEGGTCCIDKVFGSGDDEKAILENGEVMNVKSMFPSAHDENDQVKGGVVVLRLKNNVNGKGNASYDMMISSKYKDINGKDYKLENDVVFGEGNVNLKKDAEFFDNLGIRKSILLIRYVEILKLWMKYQQKQYNKNEITEEYKNIFKLFIEYFKNEMKVIGDKGLEKELKILNQIVQ